MPQRRNGEEKEGQRKAEKKKSGKFG